MNALEMSPESNSCVCLPGVMTNPKFSIKIVQIVCSTHFLLIKIMELKKKTQQEIRNINGTKTNGIKFIMLSLIAISLLQIYFNVILLISKLE